MKRNKFNIIKEVLKKNKRLYKIAILIKFILSFKVFKIDGSKKKYPKVIQLPITSKCNSRCVMCNIWQMDNSGESTVEEFADFMKDDIFKKVESVGLNGGEPSLVSNLSFYIKEILKLPKIKSINIISNGFNKDLLLKKLKLIYNDCKRENVFLSVIISIDGVGQLHNKIRGRDNVFKKTLSTIETITNNKKNYCDYISLRCTIVKLNVFNLIELDTFFKKYKIDIEFGLAIDNKRIGSNLIHSNFSVVDNKDINQTAKEFIHSKSQIALNFYDKFKYFAIFYWLDSKKKKRLLGCSWKDRDITLDSRGDIFYCAVASKSLGNLKSKKGKDIFLENKNIEYRQKIIQNNCDNCIHDYDGKNELSGIVIFLKDYFFERMWIKIYRIKNLILW